MKHPETWDQAILAARAAILDVLMVPLFNRPLEIRSLGEDNARVPGLRVSRVCGAIILTAGLPPSRQGSSSGHCFSIRCASNVEPTAIRSSQTSSDSILYPNTAG